MNSGKALDDDDPASQVTWLQGGMLSAGALAVVLVTDHNPGQTILLQTGEEEGGKNTEQ